MEPEVKKAFILLKSLILHYHGLDEDERLLLESSAEKLNAHAELEWANTFISDDYMSAYARSREFFSKTIGQCPTQEKLNYLTEVWEENHLKGYVTEMETTAMINIAKDWHVEKEFMKSINN